MNYNDIVSNKEQTTNVDSEVLIDKKEANFFAGDSNPNFKAQDTKIQFDISKLLSIEQLEFRESGGDICGITDTRTRVPNTTTFPWRAICRLIITRDDGKDEIASGWLNGKGTVITAGHAVFSRELRKWNKSIVVIPGKNGSVAAEEPPYGMFTSTDFYSVKGWTEQLDKDYDYGAIILSTKIGERTGYFGFRTDLDSEISNKPIKISGYPSDKIGAQMDTQWYSKGGIQFPLYPRKIAYKLYTVKGDSGCPVWLDDANYQAIGIHVHGGCPHSAIRVTRDVYDNLLKWRNKGDA